MEQPVMWGYKITFSILIVIAPNIIWGQHLHSKTWGFSLSPGFSKGKVPSGLVETYDPPGFIDFKITEPAQFAIHASAFLRKKGRWLSHTKQLGVSTYYYRDIYSYDPATTATNYLWGKRSLFFIEGGYKLGKDISLGKLTVFPEIGITGNYLIYSYYKSEYTWLGSTHKLNQNLTNTLDKFNFGFSVSIKARGKLNDKFDFEFGPCYKHLLKDYFFPGDRVLFFYGLSLDLVHRANEQ